MITLSKTLITVSMLLACATALAARDEVLINATRENQLRHDATLAAQHAAAGKAASAPVAAAPATAAH